MTEPFSPQFNTQVLDLSLKKGETTEFYLLVTGSSNIDFRNALIFAEIRRKSPGYNLVKKFTASTTNGSGVISIKAYPPTSDKSKILSLLPIRVGDLITVEGSGIIGARANIVTDSQITVSSNATTAVSEARILSRSLSVASFDYRPQGAFFTVNCTAVNSNTLTVNGVTSAIPAGTQLVFSTTPTPTVVTTANDVSSNATSITLTSSAAVLSASAIVDRCLLEVTATTTSGSPATVSGITVKALSGSIGNSSNFLPGIPLGTTLNFAQKSLDGWKYIANATLTASSAGGATSSVLTVSSTATSIPNGSIAMFSTLPFNQLRFLLNYDITDTQYIEQNPYSYETSGFRTNEAAYSYDVLARLASGKTIRIMQGACNFKDHWSDLL